MNLSNMNNQPTIEGLNELDVALLMSKYSILLGKINFGTPTQRKEAKAELEEFGNIVKQHVSPSAFKLAQHHLGISDDELKTSITNSN